MKGGGKQECIGSSPWSLSGKGMWLQREWADCRRRSPPAIPPLGHSDPCLCMLFNRGGKKKNSLAHDCLSQHRGAAVHTLRGRLLYGKMDNFSKAHQAQKSSLPRSSAGSRYPSVPISRFSCGWSPLRIPPPRQAPPRSQEMQPATLSPFVHPPTADQLPASEYPAEEHTKSLSFGDRPIFQLLPPGASDPDMDPDIAIRFPRPNTPPPPRRQEVVARPSQEGTWKGKI